MKQWYLVLSLGLTLYNNPLEQLWTVKHNVGQDTQMSYHVDTWEMYIPLLDEEQYYVDTDGHGNPTTVPRNRVYRLAD